MGQQGSRRDEPDVDRAGLDEEEYEQLRTTLGVEDSSEACIGLPAFLARFPPHLRPLVQPLFFQLGRAQARSGSGGSSPSRRSKSGQADSLDEVDPSTTMPWPVFVAGIGELFREGASWSTLMELWVGADVDASVDLAARLCFWCAYPSLTPGPGAPGGVPLSAAAASVDGPAADPIDSVLAILRSAKDIQAASVQLQRDIPQLPGRVVPRLRQALLGTPAVCDLPPMDSRILDAGLSFTMRGFTAQLWESGSWNPLYRSWKDGRSFNGLLKGALSYPGLAAILIRTVESQVLGALSNCWEEGFGKFGGGPECILFALEPTLTVCRTSGKSSNYGYLNSKSKHSNRGIGFGGQAECCRLWIDADFEDGHVLKFDSTYQDGELIPGGEYQTPFKISHIEVWGCSGSDALERQSTYKERMGAAREQARKADRSRLIENEFDKEMFFGNTFASTKDARPLAEDVDEQVKAPSTDAAATTSA